MRFRNVLLTLSLLLPLPVPAQVTTTSGIIYSQAVRDSFRIFISYVGRFDSGSKYATAYYSDADIESGQQLREALTKEDSNRTLYHTLFIGIGQRGRYHYRRRRDLVPPLLKDTTIVQEANPGFRHADKYYAFLTTELMPMIERQYPLMAAGH